MTPYRVVALVRPQGSKGLYSTLYNTRLQAMTRGDAEDVALADIAEADLEVRELHILNEATGVEG